jgi:cytochrome c-type biogenesis protein CcmH/NrfG
LNRTLALDSENLSAHYLLGLIYTQLGEAAKAAYHRAEHQKYLPDYNAQDQAISVARRADPAADHAAQATVIYPLHRDGAPGIKTPGNRVSISH